MDGVWGMEILPELAEKACTWISLSCMEESPGKIYNSDF